MGRVLGTGFLVVAGFLSGCGGRNEDYSSIYFKQSIASDKVIEILVFGDTDSTWVSEWTLSLDNSKPDTGVSFDKTFDPSSDRLTVKEKAKTSISKTTYEKIRKSLGQIDLKRIRKGTLEVGADGVGWIIRASSWKGYTFQYALSLTHIKQTDNEIGKIKEFVGLMFESTGHELSNYYVE